VESQGVHRLLLGIDISIFGVILALTSSGSGGSIALIVGIIGLAVCATGMVPQRRRL
jgi:hypothetical protein